MTIRAIIWGCIISILGFDACADDFVRLGVVIDDVSFVKPGDSTAKTSGKFSSGDSVEVAKFYVDPATKEEWVLVRSTTDTSKKGYIPAEHLQFLSPNESFLAPSSPEKVNDIGFVVLQRMAASRKNAVISPYGIWANLQILLQSAKGETRNELERLLGEMESKSLPRAFRSHDFASASCLLHRPEIRITESFKAYAKHTGVILTESKFDDSARVEFNRWVAKNTREMIPELFTASTWDSESRVLTANACSFLGKWKEKFVVQDKPTPFHLSRMDQIELKMIHSVRECYSFEPKGADFRGVVLPYEESGIVALVVVPNELDGLARTLAAFNGEYLNSLPEEFAEAPVTGETKEISMDWVSVELSIPKFGIDSDTNLTDYLDLKESLSDHADFTRMSDDEGIKISKLIQKAKIEVDEQGTRAAGANAGVFAVTPVQQASGTFVADRPFLFMVTHWPTRSVLFAAAVFDPRQ